MRRRECLAALASLPLLACAASAAPAVTVSAELVEKATDHLLAELSGTRYRVARDLVGLPALGIEASADTLRALAASARVERVTEDEPRRPQR